MLTWPVHDPRAETPDRLPRLVAPPAWLPGKTRVEVVGESYHSQALSLVRGMASPSAVLVPSPPFADYPDSVAVYVETHLVGYLPKVIGRMVHPRLLGFAQAHGGRLPACPALIEGESVVLSLDVTLLGLPPETFGSFTDVVETLMRRLDQPPPHLTGHDPAARAALEAAEDTREEIDADWGRDPQAWPRLEQTVCGILDDLVRARDPWTGRAWLTLARTRRYQKGRRDDTLRAYIEAMFHDRDDTEAAGEFLEYLTIGATVPMFVAIYRRLRSTVRAALMPTLLSVSYAEDRHGRLDAEQGAALRAALAEIGDPATVAALEADAGLRAERAYDLPAAVDHYRQAVANGSTDPAVADRLSIWLTKQGEFAEAAAVLKQAAPPPPGAQLDRMRKRLERCERQMS